MEKSEELLKINNLNAWFDQFHAVKNINFTVLKNDIVALIGPSGCGKSTFIRCINRLHEEVPKARVSGEVLLQGQNIYDRDMDPVKVRRQVGMVFQKPNPFPGLTIFENVAVGLKLSGIKRKSILSEIVEKSLKQAAIWDEVKDKLNQPGTSLSGGQQQRLCIARALAVSPPILLMDEPTSALDPISTARIEDLLQELKKHVTIVIVTHNMQQASRVSSKTAFFLSGDLMEFGETSQIFTNPKVGKTEEYITGRFG